MERERRSREYWEQELSEYWDSGLTIQEYSDQKELPYEITHRWIRVSQKTLKCIDSYAPSVSVAHASAKAWKLGFNLHAKSSGLAKVEFSAILQQEDPRNINQHPRC